MVSLQETETEVGRIATVHGNEHDPEAPPGSWRSYLCIEPGWSNLANTPLRRHMIRVHEGGISTPLIVHWPAKYPEKVRELAQRWAQCTEQFRHQAAGPAQQDTPKLGGER